MSLFVCLFWLVERPLGHIQCAFSPSFSIRRGLVLHWMWYVRTEVGHFSPNTPEAASAGVLSTAHTPSHWGDIAGAFCSEKRQSPIDIVSSLVKTNHSLGSFTFLNFGSQQAVKSVINNGHTGTQAETSTSLLFATVLTNLPIFHSKIHAGTR